MSDEVYIRLVYEAIGSPDKPVRRVARVEIVNALEEVVGNLPVTHAALSSSGPDIAEATFSTYRFMVTEE
jgi:hypothetical protein